MTYNPGQENSDEPDLTGAQLIWHFEEGAGEKVTDEERGVVGEIIGTPTWVEEGASGGALHFDGASYVEAPIDVPESGLG